MNQPEDIKFPPLPLDLDTSPSRMSIQIKAGELAAHMRRWGNAVYKGAIAASLASQSQAAQPSIDTPEFMDALGAFYEQASCEDFDKNAYDAARKAVLDRLAGQSQATRAVPDLHNAIMNLPAVMPNSCEAHDLMLAYKIGHRDARHAAAELVNEARAAQEVTQQAAPELTVWYGPMPESNGKSNFTATLKRKGASFFDTDSYTFVQSEYPDRVRYEADSMRYLIGELSERPDILDYDADKHSDYVAPTTSTVSAPEEVLQWAVERWNAEVANRPLVNVHRRALDDTWRQVIRRVGGDPDSLIGPSHDDLAALRTTSGKGDAV